ncbi:hypothetical protein LTR94_026091, partial [Friedmanniomyces endolithicus]
ENANATGLNATIRVTGVAAKPEIAFASTPALPQDELLSRLLFGTSITKLSAPEALQLAAAVAKAGRTAKLAQVTVPPTRAPLPIGGIEGYTHCGFDRGQTLAAWNALRAWVEQGRKPDAELR